MRRIYMVPGIFWRVYRENRLGFSSQRDRLWVAWIGVKTFWELS